MTSPVDTSVKYFHSGMPGAPTLAGVAGQLIALLDACLVNGFGALTLTSIVVSGGVATAAFAGTFPAAADSVVLVSGATGPWSDLNGEQKVTALGSGTFQFATALSAGTATGTITAKMAPAGWAKPFSGTNLAAYRSNDITSNRFFLRVNDTNALDARVVGYETMSAISTGTNLFPTNAQRSGGGYWSKAQIAGAETVSWMIFANGKRFWIAVASWEQNAYSGGAYDAMHIKGFGDFHSLKSTLDAYNGFLFNSAAVGSMYPTVAIPNSGTDAPDIAITRLHTNVIGAAQGRLYGAGGSGSGYASGLYNQGLFGPVNGVPGRLMLTHPYLGSNSQDYGVRGDFPEVWHTPQWIPVALAGFAKTEVLAGVGPVAGRKLMVCPGHYTPQPSTDGTSRVATFFDITGPWA